MNHRSNKVICFTKMSGSDNDFVVIDNRRTVISQRASLARVVCQRKTSVGADGLIVIEKSKKADFKMRIFNPDGSEAEMCGNGARCAALYVSIKPGKRLTMETGAGVLTAKIMTGNSVKLKMPEPKDLKLNFNIMVDKKPQKLSYLNTGVPHAVLWVGAIDKVDVYNLGKKIRYHSSFQPGGTNVNFVKVKDRNSIYVRTYERGVEDETLACGTGSTASAIIAGLTKGLRSPVSVHTRGGEVLKIYFSQKDNKIENMYLEGKVKFVFAGKMVV
ncbi:MAG: diaminopimelate epimerase [bacterium]